MASRTPRKRRLRVGLLGLGRAGRALRSSLRAAGYSVSLLKRGSPPPASTEGKRPLDSPGPPFDLIVLAVPDDAIAAESWRLARAGAAGRAAMHLSGALDSSALSALARTGALVFSFHPLRSFSGKPGESFDGCLVAVEGSAPAVRIARSLARDIGARPRNVSSEAKPLYHAAATLAAGGTAALVAAAARAASAAGLEEGEALREFALLAISAAENVRRLGFPEGATGPLARGDRATLRLHRLALAGHPRLKRLYRELARVFRELIAVDRHSGRH